MNIPTLAELTAKGQSPDVLFWVGCAGSFDDRYKRVTLAFAKILNAVGVSYAVLGTEENCTGDPARRAGNEFLFRCRPEQHTGVEWLRCKKIVTACRIVSTHLKMNTPNWGNTKLFITPLFSN